MRLLTKWLLTGALIVCACSLGVREVRAEANCRCDSRDDAARITSHLILVENMLRARDTSMLSPTQRAARAASLDQLHAYATRGAFPSNRDFPGERVPYFVDADGVHCAVAFVMAQSGQTELVESIVERFNNARVRDMPAAAVVSWASQHGLTLDELALIQPDYCGGCSQWECGYSTCEPNFPGGNNQCVPRDVPDGTPCDPFHLRTISNCFEQICEAGSCVEGRPFDCDDGDPATVDSCDEATGCVHEPREEPTTSPSCSVRTRETGGGDWTLLAIAVMLALRRRLEGVA